ncbi:MAG: transglycosylase SLT domain-containing protein [Pseudobdellovibrio sp.]
MKTKQKLLSRSILIFSAIISLSCAHTNKRDIASTKNEIIPNTWTPPNWLSYEAIGYDVNTFAVPEGLKKDVDFWIKIYTQYTTKQGVFHIAGDTQKTLGDFDLTQVYANQKWSAVRKELESELLIKRHKRILAKRHKIPIEKIRIQMGLKDRMEEAIKVSGMYLPMMEKIFEAEKIPKELTRVVFVESSFNIEAQSKVGASGLWQIMPNIGKSYKYISDEQDLRNHPLYATKVAAKIFKQNYQILKSWPLAVTGYNHGVGSMGKIVKKYKSNDIAYLINNVNSNKSFGFASRNFYATYLAALYVESHANLYFPEPIYKHPPLNVKYLKLTKKFSYDDLLALFNNDEKLLRLYNPHIKKQYLKKGKTLPAGVIANIPPEKKTRLAESGSEEPDI